MNKVLIVGQGIAGTSIGFTLHKKQVDVTWIDQPSMSQASRIASGLYNPIVLKRMRMVHLAEAFLSNLDVFYRDLEAFINTQFYFPSDIYRVLHDAEEQNNWYNLKDNKKWSAFLGDIIHDVNVQNSPFGLGIVQQTGWCNTALLLEGFQQKMKNHIIEDVFQHDELSIEDGTVAYKNMTFDAVVFAEGWRAAMDNPFYPKDVFRPSKGELLTVELEEDKAFDKILHFKHFLIPLEKKGHFKTGATYVHGDLSEKITESSKAELLKSLKTVYRGSVNTIKQDVGIRAATKDRKPIIGQHPKFNNIYFLNGLGSRSILMAPYLSKSLANLMLEQTPVDPSIDINRFSFLT
ncbi:MAG: FAD-binding oxidoreductase [Cryomorphaceae bacterium]|nr:FAD-binding oxidoreductase [Cryomorphaceae bacterium]